MNKIAVLIDYTPTCIKSIQFAVGIASTCQSDIVLVHIASDGTEEKKDEFIANMDSYTALIPENIEVEKHVGFGNFYSVIPYTVTKLEVDFLIVGTHGKVGLKQNLLGSNILKLVKSLHVPSLVISDHSVYSEKTFAKILFPIAADEDFNVKLNQVSQIAKPFGSKVCLIYIEKEPIRISSEYTKNLDQAVAFFTSKNIDHEVVKEEATEYSVGHSKHLLKYVDNNEVGCICIMSKIANSNHYLGNADKESILLNDSAIPVFCANQG